MCNRVFLRRHCSEDSPRKIYLKYLALCQALSKCLKNRSCSSHSYFRLRNSSNITGIIVHWRELKAKVWSCMVTQLLVRGRARVPSHVSTLGCLFCRIPLTLRTHLSQLSSSVPHCSQAFHLCLLMCPLPTFAQSLNPAPVTSKRSCQNSSCFPASWPL